jgi:hypothetical protein
LKQHERKEHKQEQHLKQHEQAEHAHEKHLKQQKQTEHEREQHQKQRKPSNIAGEAGTADNEISMAVNGSSVVNSRTDSFCHVTYSIFKVREASWLMVLA